MKKSVKIALIVAIAVAAVLILTLVFVFSGASGSLFYSPQSDAANTAQGSAAITATVPPSASASALPSASASSAAAASPTPEPTVIQEDDPVEYPDNKIEYEFYDVVQDSVQTEEVDLDKQEDLSYPLSLVAGQLFGEETDQSPLKYNSLQITGDALYIDFTSAILKANFGSYGEAQMLDSVAKVYLDNIPSLQSVYISVDGQDYESGHIAFSKDEPYMTRADIQ